MRDIKFRAWDTSDEAGEPANTMYYFDLTTTTLNIDWLSRNCPVMQYTGLKDKNGTEVYESDILRNNVGITVPVHWHEWAWDASTPGGDQEEYVVITDPGSFEVVGNIYENPELLK